MTNIPPTSTTQAPDRKLSIVIEAFTPRSANTLRGFATIVVPELHLRIHDIAIHVKGSARWVTPPGRPQLGCNGTVRRNANGKVLYAPILEFTDRKTHDAFGHRVIAALLKFAPAALETEEEYSE